MKLSTQVMAEAMCWDMTGIGAEANHLQAWRWLAEETGCEWGVVLEDDVVICRDFFWQLRKALANAPTPVVGLYLGRGRPPHWQPEIAKVISSTAPFGARPAVSYLTADAMLSCQGYAMRIELFGQHERVRHWTKAQTRGGKPIDEAMSEWLRVTGTRVSYPVPSLVDHLDGPTLVTHYDGPRNGTTALMADDCDPSGAHLPEVRKAWAFGAHGHWDSSSIEVDTPLTT
jgi:hypothetical protein